MTDAALYILVWPEERVTEALSEVSKELTIIWGQFKLSIQAQARLAELGFTDVDILGALDDNEVAVRAFVLGGLGFRLDSEFITRGTVARVISAWRSAAQRGQKRTAAEADQIAGDLPRTLPKNNKALGAHSSSQQAA